MKNGEAIKNAAKALFKELGIGLKAEKESVVEAAGKVVSSYKEGTLKENVKQTVEKNAAVAGEFLSTQADSIEKEIQRVIKIVEEKRAKGEPVVVADAEVVPEKTEEEAVPAEETAAVEEPVEAADPVEEAPVAEDAPVQE